MIGFGVAVLIVAVVILIVKQQALARNVKELHQRLSSAEDELHRVGRIAEAHEAGASPSSFTATPPAQPSLARAYPIRSVPPPLPSVLLAASPPRIEPAAAPAPPPAPVMPGNAVPPLLPREPEWTAAAASPSPLPAEKPATPEWLSIHWENFLGVKLFAWVGGLALFLGVAFFVKWSFDRNLITPLMRVIIGAVTGLGLIAGGLRMPRARYLVTVQTLCATGIVVLYADCFAAHAYYGFIDATPAFALMTLITMVAFTLAVRLEAQVIAVLGVLGGFLTPPLLSTGQDHPVGLFGYLGLLDAGLIAVALRKRWNYLVLLAAAATVFMEWGWVNEFFAPSKLVTAMTVFLGFALLFIGALAAAQRRERVDKWVSAAAVVMPAMALGFALFLLGRGNPEITKRVWLLFGFVFAADLLYLAMAWLREELRVVHVAAGGAVFVLLMRWTAEFLSADLLTPALALYLVFAVLHTVFPLALQRAKPSSLPLAWAHLFPPMALVLVLVPLSKLAESSFLVWPVVLLIDLVAIGMAVLTASLTAILAVFALTVLATALWIFQLPPSVAEVPGMLVVIGGFAIFFMAAAVFAARKVFSQVEPAAGQGSAGGTPVLTRVMFGQMTSLAAVMPFLLLTLVVLRLPLENPAPVFGLAALLAVMLLGVTRLLTVEWLPVVALGSTLLVEWTWHFARFAPGQSAWAIAWYLGFSALFLAFPFLFRGWFAKWTGPWVASALALPLHFTILYRAIKAAAPDFGFPGLVPAALAVPCFLGMWRLVQPRPVEGRERLAQVALFGGATLFFVTLIFPIQFERQWITVGWALEGAALLWLFHRVPHAGLRLAGVALLVAGFARLALNPWVFTAYGRTGTPILNWYLYAYGIVAACQLTGAGLLAPPRDRVGGLRVPPLLYALGTLLAFLLLNIEIADCFSARGGPLVFHLSASFEQDMTYSLAWGLFAFALLAIGLMARNAPTRYAGMALLVVTLLKLFLHDLWRLGGLSRVGSLVGLAVVLLVVSLVYQRFLASGVAARKKEEPAP